jgi:hypothetical protein
MMMFEVKFCTPGPWVVQEPDPESKGVGLLIKPVSGQVVAEVDYGPDMAGNAHLIAAAPELLEAIRKAVFALNTARRFSVGDTNSYAIAALCDKAIAKAEGRKK